MLAPQDCARSARHTPRVHVGRRPILDVLSFPLRHQFTWIIRNELDVCTEKSSFQVYRKSTPCQQVRSGKFPNNVNRPMSVSLLPFSVTRPEVSCNTTQPPLSWLSWYHNHASISPPGIHRHPQQRLRHIRDHPRV